MPNEEDGDDEFTVESFWHRKSLSDPEAFAYFFDKYYDRVFRFLQGMLRDRGEAEQVTQETFTTAFEKRSRFVFRKLTIEGWIFRIARRNGIRAKARLGRQTPMDPGEVADGRLVEFRPGPEHRLLIRQEGEELYRALDRLDPDCQSWLVLHYIVGLSTPRVAAVAGVPSGTMKSRLSRCLDKLRVLMGEGRNRG